MLQLCWFTGVLLSKLDGVIGLQGGGCSNFSRCSAEEVERMENWVHPTSDNRAR